MWPRRSNRDTGAFPTISMAANKSGACSSRRTCSAARRWPLLMDFALTWKTVKPLPNEKRMFRSKIVVKQVLGLCHKPNDAKRHQQTQYDENKNQACALAQTESRHCQVDGGAVELPQISGRVCGHGGRTNTALRLAACLPMPACERPKRPAEPNDRTTSHLP